MTTRIHRTSTQLDSEPTGHPPVRQSAQVPVDGSLAGRRPSPFDGGHLSRATWGQGVGLRRCCLTSGMAVASPNDECDAVVAKFSGDRGFNRMMVEEPQQLSGHCRLTVDRVCVAGLRPSPSPGRVRHRSAAAPQLRWTVTSSRHPLTDMHILESGIAAIRAYVMQIQPDLHELRTAGKQ